MTLFRALLCQSYRYHSYYPSNYLCGLAFFFSTESANVMPRLDFILFFLFLSFSPLFFFFVFAEFTGTCYSRDGWMRQIPDLAKIAAGIILAAWGKILVAILLNSSTTTSVSSSSAFLPLWRQYTRFSGDKLRM